MAKSVKRTPVTSEESNKTDTSEILKALASEANAQLKRDTGNALSVGNAGGDVGVPYWVRSGIPALDYAVGGKSHPGFPGARFIELYGAEGSGKSTLAVWMMKMAMENENAIAYYQDAERVLTPEIIRGTGINIDHVMCEQPDTLEEVFDAQEAVLKIIHAKWNDKPAVITLDSIAACSTNAEIEGDMDDAQMASHARLMSKGLRKLKKYITDSKVLSIWVNQIREKIGVSWGKTTDTFGGKAMKFYASVRIELTKTATLKNSDKVPYGCTIQALVEKNKVAPPLRKITYDILFMQDENGSYPRIDVEGAVLDWCKDHGMIEGSTGRYVLNGKSMYKKEARAVLMEDRELYQQLVDMAYSVNDECSDEDPEE